MNMATTHPVAPEDIMALVDGELPADQAQAITTHLDHCAGCAEIAEQMRATSLELAAWAVEDAPQGWEETVQKLAEQAASEGTPRKPAKTARPSFWNWRALSIAGVGALASVLILVSITMNSERHLPKQGMAYLNPEAKVRGNDGLVGGSSSIATNALQPAPPPAPSAVVSEGREMFDYARPDEKVVADAPVGVTHAITPVTTAPMIARTVALTVTVKDIPAARAMLESTLRRYQAYAAQLTVNTPEGGARSFQASLRVPAPQLASALADLRGMGRVQNESQSGEEVTQQHADLVARLQNSRETEQRLRDILSQRTGKIEDVLQVEEEIARVRGEIEGMEADQKQLEHRVDFATIDLQLAEEYKETLSDSTPSVSTRLGNAFVSGIRHAGDTVLGIVLFLEEFGPALLIWAIILGAPAFLLIRRYRKIRASL